MRATGLKFTSATPVRIPQYYRAQWGQLKGKVSIQRLRRNLNKYRRRHRIRVQKLRTRKNRGRRMVPDSKAKKRWRAQQARKRIDNTIAFNIARRDAMAALAGRPVSPAPAHWVRRSSRPRK